MHGCRGSLLSVAVVLALASSAGVQRDFPGIYTIVNRANGRRIGWSVHGFFANKRGAIADDSQWRILPQGNDTYAIANSKNDMRILAQNSMESETGFSAVNNGPIFPDQKWHLHMQDDGSYTIINVRSGRRVSALTDVDGAAGLVAVKPTASIRDNERWWLINQERDEAGHYILKLGSVQNAKDKLAQAFKGKVSELASISLELKNSKAKCGRDLAVCHGETSSLQKNIDVESRISRGLSERLVHRQNESILLQSKLKSEVDARAKLVEDFQAAEIRLSNLSSQIAAE
jgi:hypothetical protein